MQAHEYAISDKGRYMIYVEITAMSGIEIKTNRAHSRAFRTSIKTTTILLATRIQYPRVILRTQTQILHTMLDETEQEADADLLIHTVISRLPISPLHQWPVSMLCMETCALI